MATQSGGAVESGRAWFLAWLVLVVALVCLAPVPALMANAEAGPWQHKMQVTDIASLLNVGSGLLAFALPGVLLGIALGSLLALPAVRSRRRRGDAASARRIMIGARTVGAGVGAGACMWTGVLVILG